MSASEFFIILEAASSPGEREPSILEHEIARATELGKKIKRQVRTAPVFCGTDLIQVQTSDAIHDALKGKLRVLSALGSRATTEQWQAAWKQIFSDVPSGVLVLNSKQWIALAGFLGVGAFPCARPLDCVRIFSTDSKQWSAKPVD
jgi:hypothetical protein